MNESTTDIRIVPLPTGQDVLTEVLRDGARQDARPGHRGRGRRLDRRPRPPQGRGRAAPGRPQRPPPRADHPDRHRADRGPAAPGPGPPAPPDQREAFTSAILPPYLRKTKSLEGLIPWLYLKGVSTGDFSEALQALLGPEAPGLSATTVTRLKAAWEDEHEAWSKRSLKGKHYVYVWADGVHFNIRLEEGRQCILVLMGATADGKKELIAIADGYRESEQSWKELLLDCKARGLEIEPSLAIGDGALGFWKAMRQVWDTTKEQRCWVHKTANVLDKLPKGSPAEGQGDAARDLPGREPKEAAEKAFDLFVKTYEAKYPKATECLVEGSRCVADVLRLPGGALGAHPDDEPDRERCSRRCG